MCKDEYRLWMLDSVFVVKEIPKKLELNFIPFYLILTLFSFPHMYKMSFM